MFEGHVEWEEKKRKAKGEDMNLEITEIKRTKVWVASWIRNPSSPYRDSCE